MVHGIDLPLEVITTKGHLLKAAFLPVLRHPTGTVRDRLLRRMAAVVEEEEALPLYLPFVHSFLIFPVPLLTEIGASK